MGLASQLDPSRIPAEQRLDVIEVLVKRDLVSLALIDFVPLIMVVKNQRNDVVKIDDEAVLRRVVDEPVEPLVEIGKVVIVSRDALQQRAMLGLQRLQAFPRR